MRLNKPKLGTKKLTLDQINMQENNQGKFFLNSNDSQVAHALMPILNSFNDNHDSKIPYRASRLAEWHQKRNLVQRLVFFAREISSFVCNMPIMFS